MQERKQFANINDSTKTLEHYQIWVTTVNVLTKYSDSFALQVSKQEVGYTRFKNMRNWNALEIQDASRIHA